MKNEDWTKTAGFAENRERSNSSDGFTLLEVVIAMVILMVAVLGVFAAFTYSTRYNTGNSQRSQALSVFQKEVELLRSAKFTPGIVDSTINTPDNGQRDITGGIKADRVVTSADGRTYLVHTEIDDDPFTAGVQVNPVPTAPTLKEITLTVTPQGADGNWVTASKATIIFRRVRAN